MFALFCIPWAANAQNTLTVYDEGTTTNNYVPIYGLYCDEGVKCEFVIPAEQLAEMTNGTISAMKFYLATVGSSTIEPSFTIFVKEVDFTTMTAYTGNSDATTVFNSTFTFTSGATNVEIEVPFSENYTYEGGNLLIGVYQNGTSGYTSLAWTGVSQNYNSAWCGYGSSTGSAQTFLPKTTFTYTPGATDCTMPTSINVNNISANGATVTWEGDGSAWNLRYKASADADFTMVNGLNSQSYTLTGLNGNTTYSVGVQTVCTGSTSIFKSTNFTTANPCAAPTNFVASNITGSSATISWTAGYQETAWTVKYKKSSESSWDNATTVSVSETPTTSLTGLDGLTVYNVRVYNCTGESDPYLSGNFTTAASFPYSQDFSGSGIPTGWAQYSGLLANVMTGTALTTASYGWSNGTNNGVLDGNHIYANIYSTGCSKWIVTPAIPVESGARLTFDVAYTAYSGTAANPQTTGTDDKFVVLASTDNMATWTILRQWDNAGSEYVLNELTPTALHQIFDLADYAGQNVIVAFYGESTESNADNNIHVDNVVFELTPSCEKPTGLSVENNGLDATFTWSSDATSFDVAYSMDNTANPDNVIVATVNTTSYEFTNLALGDHYVWVRTNCSATEQSEWAGPRNIHIGYCLPAPTSVDNNGISNVTFGTGDNIVNNTTSMGTSVATYLDYTNLTGALQAGVESTVAITYKTSYTYGTIIWVDFDNSLSFEESEIVYMGTSTSANPTTLNATFVIPATVTPGNYVMRIGGADSQFDGYISDPSAATAPNPCYTGTYACFQDYTLSVLEAPSCMPISGLTSSNVTAHTVDLTWTAGGDETAWVVAYKAADEEEFTEVPATTSSFTLSGLSSETTYTVKVAANCGVSQSLYSQDITFTTTVACPAPTALTASNVTPTGATISWEGGAESYNLRYGVPGTPDPTAPATIILTAGDVWQDGSGYQMLLDADATAYGDVFTATGAWTATSYEAFEYTIPVDADCSVDATNFVFNNSVSIQVPAGTYDWVITNPSPGDQIYIASNQGNVGGRADDYVFEAGMTYEFVLSMNGETGNDQTNVTSYSASNVVWTDMTNVTSPVALEGLTPETQYILEVQAVCGGIDGNSEWTASSFTTLSACAVPGELTAEATDTEAALNWTGYQDSYNVQYRTAGFDGYYVNETWDGENGDWSVYNFASGGGINSTAGVDGTACFAFHWTTDPPQYLISPDLRAGVGGKTLTFSYKAYSTSYPESFMVGFAIGEDITWEEEVATEAGDTDWHEYQVVVPEGAKYFVISCTSNDAYYLYLDNIVIYAEDEIVEAGTWMTTTATGTTANLTDLTPETEYEWQVQGVDCDGDGTTTEWSEMGNFTTEDCEKIVLNEANDFTWTEDFETMAAGITEPWTGVEPLCWPLLEQYSSASMNHVGEETDTMPQVFYYPEFDAADGNYTLRMKYRSLLAMPELDETVEMSRLHLSMYVRQPKGYYKLLVGVWDETTHVFDSLFIVDNQSTNMEKFECDFSRYEGNGRYIAFKNVGGSSSNPHCSNYLDSIKLTYAQPVNCDGITVGDPEGFETYTTNAGATGVEPDCWEVIKEERSLSLSTKPQIYAGFNTTEGGNYTLRMRNRCVYAMPEFADDVDISTLTMTFQLRQPKAAYMLQVGVVDAEGNFEMVEEINNATTEMEEVSVDFTGHPGTRIAFRNVLNGRHYDYSYNYIDDISFTVNTAKVSASEGSDVDVERYLDNIAVYPNPTTGMLYIDAVDVQKVECYNQMGQLVGVYDNANELNISELSNGVYMLRITVPQGVTMRKVVKR